MDVKRRFWTEVQKRIVAASQKYCCAMCRRMLGTTWAADHIRPLRTGGSNALSNCQILCADCHAQKTQMETIEAADEKRRDQKNTSKYWDPNSLFCMPRLTEAQNSVVQSFRKNWKTFYNK